MSNLIRWEPFREMASLRRMMDRMFDDAMLETPEEWQSQNWGLALDVMEKDDEYIVKTSIPGIKPENLEITYNNNVLTIKGETKEENEIQEARYHMRERRFGTFSRSITVPSSVKSDDIQAEYDAGVLTLRLPKAEEVKAKRISVKATDSKLIEGKSKEVKK
jgi:HSP20 family protein